MIGTSPLKIGQIAPPRMRRLIGGAFAPRIEPNPERFMWHSTGERQSRIGEHEFWKMITRWYQ
jgi:hypothetical protein